MKLDSSVKLVCTIWLLAVVVVCGVFGALRYMSTDHTLQAHILIVHQERVEKDHPYRYRAKLIFHNPILRAHAGAVAISIHNIQWDQGIPLHYQHPSPDSNHIIITSSKPLALQHTIGTLTYSAKILVEPLHASLKWITFALVVWLVFTYTRQAMRNFTAKHPKRIMYKNDSSTTFSLGQQNLARSLAPLYRIDMVFLCASGALILGLGALQFWLGFPGYHIIGDTYSSIGLIKSNWHPVFISYVLELLYTMFGKHLYYLYLWNLVPFYLGLLCLVWGFYLRFRSFWALLLLFPVCIGNIYFQNFVQYHSFALPMLLFCGYSMVLFALVVPMKRPTLLWG